MINNALLATNSNVLPLSSTTNNRSASVTSTSPNSSGSERDLFMTLLVAQLKNQDPLSPQDGTAFVGQLAQFNSLDQLVGIRESIEQLTHQLQQTNQDSRTLEIA